MLLTVTVNGSYTFRSPSIKHAKQIASAHANKWQHRSSDRARVYVSSGTLKMGDKSYTPGSIIWMKRVNQTIPEFKAGKWII